MRKPVVMLLLLALVPAARAQQAAANEPIRISLRDVVILAVEKNLDIAVARIDPQIDAQGVVVSEAAFDPRLEAAANYQQAEVEPANAFGVPKEDTWGVSGSWIDPLQWGGEYVIDLDYGDLERTLDLRNVSFGQLPHESDAGLRLSYTQSVLRNLGIEINRTEIEQALVTQRISEQALQGRIQDIVESVESAYWTLVGARRQYDVSIASLDLAKDFLRQTKIRVEVGTLPPIEITTAEAEVADREERVILAEVGIRDAEDLLRRLAQVDPNAQAWNREIVPSDEPGFAPVEIDLQKVVATAWERRTEIKQAELALRNAELSQRFLENQVRPDLRVGGFLDLAGNSFEADQLESFDTTVDGTTITVSRPRYLGRTEPFSEIPSFDNNTWGVFANFVYPIGNRAAQASSTRARLAVDQAKLQLENTRQLIRVEVREAARALDAAARRVATTRANVVLQRRKLEAEQKRYENGLSTAFQVLTFQTDLRDAESREITAVVDYNRAQARLGRAQGTLLEDRGISM